MRRKVSKIDEITEVVTKGTTPTTYGMPFTDSGVNFIKAEALNGDSSLDRAGFAFVSESTHEKLKRSILAEGDILVTIAGAQVGRCGIVRAEHLPANTNQAVGIIRVLRERVNPRFIYFFFKNPQTFRMCQGIGGQAAQPNINLTVLKGIELRLPDLENQDAIVGVLSAYDDLIENNRRRIALLEAAARLLYREWFVHFRLPGYEHVKIIDGLPEGWERVRIEQVLVALESGGRPRGGALESDGIPSIGAANVIGLGQYDYSKEKYVPEDYFAKMRRGVIQSRDVMLYKDGAHIGRSSMVGDGFPHSQCAVNEHVFILRAQADVGQSYLYFWLSQSETRQSVVNLNANTAQPGISQDKLKTLWFLLPPGALRYLFNESVEAQIAQIFRLALMNQKLAQARDLLLPRLMNGEITV